MTLATAAGALLVVRDLRAMTHVDDWCAVTAEGSLLMRRERVLSIPWSAFTRPSAPVGDTLTISLRRSDGSLEEIVLERVEDAARVAAAIAARHK